MSNSITRRDILKFAGGGILGAVFSPLPWKLLDDSAIWTQNWSLIPPLPRGTITTRFTHCTMCNAGCAVKARCVSGTPYYLSGIGTSTTSAVKNNVICPLGIAAHHMASHPLRIEQPCRFSGKSDAGIITAVSRQEALAELSRRCKNATGSVVILDRQPERAISEIYRRFMGLLPNGMYATSPAEADSTISALQSMMNGKIFPLGYDCERAKLIVSFGAPILDNWGSPARMASVSALRKETGLRIVQIDHGYSRTAMQSDQWIAIHPGTEKFLALAVAGILLEHKQTVVRAQRTIGDFSAYRKSIREFTPESTAAVTGVDAATVRNLAAELLQSRSTIVLSGSDPGGGPLDADTEKIIASLNLLIGSVGVQGGIVERAIAPGYSIPSPVKRWNDIPDGSIEVLMVDGAESGYAVPWQSIAKKLQPNKSTVVSFSPMMNDIAAHADILIPGPTCFESITDIPTATGSAIPAFGISTPILPANDGTVEPIDVIRHLVHETSSGMDIPTMEELVRSKAAAIYNKRIGMLTSYRDQRSISIADIADEESFWAMLHDGAVWYDDSVVTSAQKTYTVGVYDLKPAVPSAEGLQMVPFGWRGAVAASQISPILSKVFQESELRDDHGTVLVNPFTAKQYGLTPESPVTLTTAEGSMTVTIKISTAVRPGMIAAAVGPIRNGIQNYRPPSGASVVNLCAIRLDGTWRTTPVQILKA